MCPLLGVKQTSLVRDRVSVNDLRVDLEENWHGDSNSSFPAKNCGLPARRIREKPIQATEMQGGLLLGCEGIVPATWPNHPAIPQICRERRVGFRLPAQPASRGFSGSLPTFTKASGRSPELRHQLAVFLSDLTLESASQRKNAASLPVYLFWAFSGVTLAFPADLLRF